jgi:hypothetical protein
MKKSFITFGLIAFIGVILFAETLNSTSTNLTWSNLPYTLSATVESHTLFGTQVDFSAVIKNGILEYYSTFGFDHVIFKFNQDYINKLPDGITQLNCSINRNFFLWTMSSKEYPWGKVSLSAPAVGVIELFVAVGTGLDFLITHDPTPLIYGATVLTVDNLIVSNIKTNYTIILSKEGR